MKNGSRVERVERVDFNAGAQRAQRDLNHEIR